MRKSFCLLLLLALQCNVFACFILFLTNGKEVWVGNHEDWYARDAEITFVPAARGKYGMVYFDFKSEGTAQGGMNTEGLFFDGTRTPYAPFPDNEQKKDCRCYIWTKILAECATVDSAISYIKTFQIPELEEVHILLADKTGTSAIIGVYKGQLQIHRRTGNYQVLTNFNVSDPAYGGEPACRRFDTAQQMLQRDSTASLKNIETILSKSHQEELTVYSNIYNLTTGEVTIYQLAQFDRKKSFRLSEELKKGKHSRLIADLFK
jgi:hypothetical protein